MKEITLAYSPDTDDAFMAQALIDKKVTHPNYTFKFYSKDIQELNVAAKEGLYDITAISIAAYPSIADKYVMIPVGASIGEGFGPAIIVRKDSDIKTPEDLAGKRIAVPGRETSAYFSATALLPNFDPEFMIFSDIEDAVFSGKVDAGILIHELQIDCESGAFRKIDDLGNLWAKKFDGLPLPLGTNAIRKSFSPEVIIDLVEIYRESIRYAFANRKETLEKAIASANPGMSYQLGDKYIDMFVNDRALKLDDDVKIGIQKLYDSGFEHGLCQKMHQSDYLIE